MLVVWGIPWLMTGKVQTFQKCSGNVSHDGFHCTQLAISVSFVAVCTV